MFERHRGIGDARWPPSTPISHNSFGELALGGDPSFYYSSPKGGMLWVFAVDGKVEDSPRYSAEVIEKALPVYKPQQ